MLGVGGFQRSTITVKARRAEEMGPIPIGEGERARWSFSAERYTFKLQAWFVPHASPPPVATEGEGEGEPEAEPEPEPSPEPAPSVDAGEQPRVEVLPEMSVGDEDDDDKGGKSHGAFIAPTSGAMYFRLNNEFSRLRPKKVAYVLEVGGVPNGIVRLELDSAAPSLKEAAGFRGDDRLVVQSTLHTGRCAEAGVAAGMVLVEVCGEQCEATSWATLEAHIQAKRKTVTPPWTFTFALPPPRDDDEDGSAPPSEEVAPEPDPEEEKRLAEVKELALKVKEETEAEAAIESGEQMPPPPGGNIPQTTMDIRPWGDRIRDATLAVQGQQLVLDSGRQYRRACAEHRRSATDGAASFLGRAFGGGSKSASGRTPPVNQEATGQAAQQLRQAAEKLGTARSYELAGGALRMKAELHERQSLPDAQVAALLQAAEQYRRGVGGGICTGQGIRQELVAEAMRAYDTARDVRLAQARSGSTRPLQQAADVQQQIVATYKQARKWEDAAAAQMLLDDLREGKLPAVEGAEAEQEEQEEQPATPKGRASALLDSAGDFFSKLKPSEP